MIVTRTPLRISFVGGGSDMPAFFESEPGAVVGTAISLSMYVSVNRKFDGRLRVSYSKTENVDHAGDLQHELARACLREIGIRTGLEITSVSDVPGEGTGLGSSSAFTVGLLAALARFTGLAVSPRWLAETAAKIEIVSCHKPIGKQDHYFAALGGTMHLLFTDRCVIVNSRPLAERRDPIEKHLMLLWTGRTRPAGPILKRVRQNLRSNPLTLHAMRQMVAMIPAASTALYRGDSPALGAVLHEAWCRKKTMAPGVTTAEVDRWYARAIEAGAWGGKLLGAGGGGFLLICCPPEKRETIRRATCLRPVPFQIDQPGCAVVFDSGIRQ